MAKIIVKVLPPARKHVSDFQVCQAYDAYQRNPTGPFPYELLMASTGQPEKVCYAAIERAEKHDLIEYGTSLRTGWLTDAGKAFLAEDHPCQNWL